MDINIAIEEIIKNYSTSIWLGFLTLFLTSIAVLWIKNLVTDVFNYITTRMSNLGYGAMVLWEGKLKRVETIYFKRIKIVDDEEIKFIPIDLWLKSIQTYPQPQAFQFDESKWREKPWDGRTERRKRGDGPINTN